jgi:hypothetical protein
MRHEKLNINFNPQNENYMNLKISLNKNRRIIKSKRKIKVKKSVY